MKKKVLIIGAGVSGLTTLKECLAKGITATLFEAEGHTGGQWRYMEPDADGKVHSSVYHGCIFNSCRDTSAFSDFPLDPARYPVYFGHRAFAQYLDEYSEFFDLKRHIRFNTKAIKCEQNSEGGWTVEYEQHGVVSTEAFDALFACTGHLSTPSTPRFEGLSDFKGEFSHSHVYRKPALYESKRVAVIGIGSSAVDIASEVSPQAAECHLITRTGGWIMPRFVLGKPLEAWDSRLTTYLPSSFGQWMQTLLLNLVYGKLPPEIQPKHKILGANPTIRSDFLEKVKVGELKAHRAGVERFVENGLILTNGTKLEVDAVISCTGYLIDYPYLPSDAYRTEHSNFIDSPNSVDLYKLIVPPNHRNLFFIGLIEQAGPGPLAYEIQARWSVGVLTEAVTLPSVPEMQKWTADFQAWQAKKFVHSQRHTITTDLLPYVDDLASQLSANPTIGKLSKMVFTSNPLRALSLLNSVYMDVTSSGQFRLFGEDACPELAAASILRIGAGKKEMSEGEKEGLKELGKKWNDKGNFKNV